MTKEEVQKLANPLEGWLINKEGQLLYDLAKNCSGKGVIVEIGSWKGKSTTWLAHGSKEGNKVKVYAIDPHTGSPEHQKNGKVWTFDQFKENIKKTGIEDMVIPIVKTSEEAAKYFNEPVELIFIDGAHEYEMVKKDFEYWFPKVIEGGIMAFHDTAGWARQHGPDQVVEEFVYKSRNFKKVQLVGSITYGTKTTKNSITDQIKNRTTLFQKYLYDTAGTFLSRIPTPIKKLVFP